MMMRSVHKVSDGDLGDAEDKDGLSAFPFSLLDHRPSTRRYLSETCFHDTVGFNEITEISRASSSGTGKGRSFVRLFELHFRIVGRGWLLDPQQSRAHNHRL